MAILKIPVLSIRKLIALLFLVIIAFFLGLLGKLVANKSLEPTAQAQCWIAPGGVGGECAGSSSCECGGGASGGSGGCEGCGCEGCA